MSQISWSVAVLARRDRVAVGQQAVLPEAPDVVEDDGLVRLVEAADGREGVGRSSAAYSWYFASSGSRRTSASRCTAFSLVAALLGADLAKKRS